MGMLKEAAEQGVQIDYLPTKIPCTVIEDNSGALELARLPKVCPRTKHINQSFHHFREHVERQEIHIQATPTEEQLDDILKKTASGELFRPPPPIHHRMVGPISTHGKECLYTRQKGAKIKL